MESPSSGTDSGQVCKNMFLCSMFYALRSLHTPVSIFSTFCHLAQFSSFPLHVIPMATPRKAFHAGPRDLSGHIAPGSRVAEVFCALQAPPPNWPNSSFPRTRSQRRRRGRSRKIPAPESSTTAEASSSAVGARALTLLIADGACKLASTWKNEQLKKLNVARPTAEFHRPLQRPRNL